MLSLVCVHSQAGLLVKFEKKKKNMLGEEEGKFWLTSTLVKV